MPIITISRSSLSGGTKLADELGKRLGYQVISREAIVEAAEKYGISGVELRQGLEVPPGLWQRITRYKDRYILAAQAGLVELLKDTNCVYHGYCGQLLLKELPNVLKVRLIAPEEDRIRIAMHDQHLNRDQAFRHIQTVDDQRARWVRALSGHNVNDPALYDLVINLEKMSMDSAVETVASMINHEEYRDTEKAALELRDFTLAERVKAALVFRSSFATGAINVKAKDGCLYLSGPAMDRQHDEVLRFVSSKVEGVKKVFGEKMQTDSSRAASRTAADIMLPLENYPHVTENVSIREAMLALGGSMVTLPDGHRISPRFLLVFSHDGRLVGVLSRRSLIKGLVPQFRTVEQARATIESFVAGSGKNDPMDFLWAVLFSPAAIEHAGDPVSLVMTPVTGSVDVHASVGTVVKTMLQNDIDLLPVMDDPHVIGVIIMTEVFDAVSEYVVEAKT